MSRPVMIVAGGTGGHVYPGLAVAEALRRRGVELHWMGTRRGIEARVVPAQGFPLTTIPVSGLRRAGWLRWLGAPVTVLAGVVCAIAAMVRVRPGVVLGMGGFVSGPGGVAAWLCRRPLLIHEQNAVPGLTNRLLSRLAARVLEAFPGSFAPEVHAIAVGNPVREAIAGLAPPAARAAARRRPAVLVFGGSRGARALNEIVPAALIAGAVPDLQVLHQCGAADVEATRARYAAAPDGMQCEVVAYIEDMAAAYAAADLVIARAGALTVFEIAAAGIAAVLVPYPHAVDDHQTANARHLVDREAALLMPESELGIDGLAGAVADLFAEPGRLRAMAERARECAAGGATEAVMRHCLELADA